MFLAKKKENKRQWALGWNPSIPIESLVGRLEEYHVLSIGPPTSQLVNDG
jgi:hypothetical protein